MMHTIQQFSMKYRHSSNSSSEFKVCQMIFIAQTRIRVDLKRIIIAKKNNSFTSATMVMLKMFENEINYYFAEYSNRP